VSFLKAREKPGSICPGFFMSACSVLNETHQVGLVRRFPRKKEGDVEAPLSPRARPNAPVSMPITWPQVWTPPHTSRTVPHLLKKSKAWTDYCEAERSPLEAMT
jgi:hypothetical protein